MRALPALVFFAFAVALAACGGGGHGSIVPTGGSSNGGGNSAPSSSRTTRASMVFYIPPVAKQSARRPFYISSSTASFGVAVVPWGSPAPAQGNGQIFPFATPSPCAAASAGGYTCTLTVTAPIGEDQFFVASYAVASPGPNTTPLSEAESGEVDVGASPSASLSFVMNAVVASVEVMVSPDPPNTQVFAIASPTTAPLGVKALDVNGTSILNDPTTPFASQITVNVSPAPGNSPEGISFTVNATSQCNGGTTDQGTQANFRCVADLSNVTIAYDGSTHPDSSDHAIDSFTITASAQPSSAPSPATVVLASNVVSWPISGMTNPNGGFLFPDGSSTMAYVLTNYSNAYAGTFTYGTPAASTAHMISGLYDPIAMALGPSGTVWAVDDNDGSNQIDCWSSLSSLVGGSPPTTSGFAPLYDDEDSLYVEGIAVDASDDVWFDGSDDETGYTYLGEFAQNGTTCQTPESLSSSNFVSIGNVQYQETSAIAGFTQHPGVVFNSSSDGLYVATTANLGGSATNIPILNTGSYGSAGSVATDATDAAYALFSASYPDLEELPYAGSISSVLTLVPNTAVEGYLTASPELLSLFSASGGAADRAIYADDDFEMLGVIGNLNTTPATELVSLGSVSNILATLHGPKGQQYALYEPASSDGAQIARVIDTDTWSVPLSTQSMDLECSSYAWFSVNERLSNSFTLTNVAGGTITSFPGTDPHDFIITPATVPTTMTATITDGNGRSQSLSFSLTGDPDDC